MLLCSFEARRPVARFAGLGGEQTKSLEGQDCCFFICLKQIFLSKQNLGGNAPVVTSLDRGTKKVEDHWTIGLICRVRTD